MGFTAATLCSGIGAPETAMPEWRWLWCGEIEPFPAAVLAERFGASAPEIMPDPDISGLSDDARRSRAADKAKTSRIRDGGGPRNLGDMTAPGIVGRAAAIGIPDALIAGTPCFSAGHMVLTAQGYRPIEDIEPGDLVVSHLGRLRPVVRVGNKDAQVGVLRAVGLPAGITCTADHRFLSRRWRSQNTHLDSRYVRNVTIGETEWTPAADMPGRQWIALKEFDIASPRTGLSISDRDAMALAGWYLGDGWIRSYKGKNKKQVILGVSDAKLLKFRERFPDLRIGVSAGRTCLRIVISNTGLANWLHREFGRLSHSKTIPAWVLNSAHRAELLGGYLATDGSISANGSWSAISVSRSLAFGVGTLSQTLGFTASMSFVSTKDSTTIEGRVVSQRDYWQVRAVPTHLSRKSRAVDKHLLRTVQSWRQTEVIRVYDIEVADDHSYIVDGAVVHNCQAFSVPGARGGLDDDRGNLTLVFTRICHDLVDAARSSGRRRPCVLWENVPGILSDATNAFGCFLGGLVGADDALSPPKGQGWPDAGMVSGPRARAAWRVLDAQHFGLAQRRERVFVVVDFGDGPDPARVLFEPKGLPGDYAPRREKKEKPAAGNPRAAHGAPLWRRVAAAFENPVFRVQEVAGTLGGATQEGGFRTTDLDSNGALIPAVAWALQERDSKGPDSNTKEGHLIPVMFKASHYTRGKDGAPSELCAPLAVEDDRGDQSPLVVAFDTTQITHPANRSSPKFGQPSPPISASGHPVAVAMNIRGRDCGVAAEIDDKASLRAADGGSSRSYLAIHGTQDPDIAGGLAHPLGRNNGQENALVSQWTVRRLTTIECARLQGFPDRHTQIPWSGKEADDCPLGPQYKGYGNSMPVPVIRWICRRIEEVRKEDERWKSKSE